MKKIISLTAAFVISASSFTGCGSNDTSSNVTTTESTNTQASNVTTQVTAEGKTEPTPSRNLDLKYTSLTDDTLGNKDEFLEVYENKLYQILGINTLTFIEKKEQFDTIKYNYSFELNDNEKTNMHFQIEVEKKNNQRIECVYIYDTLPRSLSPKATKPIYQSPNAGYSDINDYKICALLLPIAVFNDYTTKEELLSQYSNFITKETPPDKMPKYSKSNIENKLFSNYFLCLGFSCFNEYATSNLWAGSAIYYAKNNNLSK